MVSETALEEAKRILKFRVCSFYITFSIISVGFFVFSLIFAFRQESSATAILLIVASIAFLLVALVLAIVTVVGAKGISQNKYKIITGTVVAFEKKGGAGHRWDCPVIKTRDGKKITILINSKEENITLGQEYTFLRYKGFSAKIGFDTTDTSDNEATTPNIQNEEESENGNDNQ